MSPAPVRRLVLLVDEDPHFRATLRRALEEAGFAVGEAADGRQAEKTLVRVQPDAIVADLMASSAESASTFAQRIGEIGPPVPVYLVSSAGGAIAENVADEGLGVAGVFVKPFDAADLVRALQLRLRTQPA
jgi:DNA-binding response OmpR family regulator